MILQVLSGTDQILPYFQTTGSHAFNEAKRGISKGDKPPTSTQCGSLTPCENSKPHNEDMVQIYLVSTDLSEAKLRPKTAKPEEVSLESKQKYHKRCFKVPL